MRKFSFILFLTLLAVSVTGCKNTINSQEKTETQESQKIRVGYFANLTHSQALIGLAQQTFQKHLGEQVAIEPFVFNAGPQEIEALFANQIDIGYIGPSPAVNGYVKSRGEALRIISGASANGVALVLQPELAEVFQANGPKALEGKKIASPQQGNTQDVALRTYLEEQGLTEKTEIVPLANADQLTLFTQKELDGSWAPEPWASRLIQEAQGEVIFEEKDLWPEKEFATTVVIVRKQFLDEHPDLVKQWLQAHIEVTEWIQEHPKEAQTVLNTEIEKLTTKKLSDEVLAEAWERLQITVDPLEKTVQQAADDAYALGFLGATNPDLSDLFYLDILHEITTQRN